MRLGDLHVPKTYTAAPLAKAAQTDFCMFSDASTKAISSVAYTEAIQEDRQAHIGFVMGKSKLAPQSRPTIPRLVLRAAVLFVEMAELIHDELDLRLDSTNFYTVSKVVLSYIYNAYSYSPNHKI